MLLAAYRVLLYLAHPFLWLLLVWRVCVGKQEAGRIFESAGFARSVARPHGFVIWLHAASVGELVSVLPLAHAILARKAHAHILLTTTTRTAAALMAKESDPRLLHRYAPFDAALWLARFLRHWQPDLAVRVESEIWPNTIAACAARGVPLVLINGRLSARSFKNWRALGGTLQKVLAPFRLVLAQDDTAGTRFAALGIAVQNYGNLKWDAPPLPIDEQKAQGLRQMIGTRPFWLAASTHSGEETIISTAHKIMAQTTADILSIIVPRHPTRGDKIAADLRRDGFCVAQRSKGEAVTAATQIYLADTLGELGTLFHLTDIALIGGTVGAHGGHNALEAVRLHCAVLYGAHSGNFHEIFTTLAQANAALCTPDAPRIAAAVLDLLSNAAARDAMIEGAMACEHTWRGANGRVLDALMPLLGEDDA